MYDMDTSKSAKCFDEVVPATGSLGATVTFHFACNTFSRPNGLSEAVDHAYVFVPTAQRCNVYHVKATFDLADSENAKESCRTSGENT